MKKYHSLKEYISCLEQEGLICELDIPNELEMREIKCLSYDNRQISSDAIFVCKGTHFKKEYLLSAIERGALVYIGQTKYEDIDFPFVRVTDIRRAMAYLALLFFDNAPSKLTTIGITGTKGKSTTAYYVKSILDGYLPKECAILSSIDNYDGVIREESHLTTPEAIELHRHFDNAVSSGISHLVMEVSSQALKYDRVLGVNFDVACFNNIGSDHISPIEHPNFEDYFESKLKILDICKVACINTAAEHSDRVLKRARERSCKIITYGFSESDDIYCKDVCKREDGIYFTVRTPDYAREMCITMPGMFNVENALAAIAICTALKIPVDAVANGLKIARAAGRMEVFRSADKRVVVVVDYAHNKMSFEALYRSTFVEYPGKSVITVFGCPGGKAFLRRTDLGETAGENSDFVIITEEDSGEEPFANIAKDIAGHVESRGCRYEIIEDRGAAIRDAIMNRFDDKVILVTGKGRETRQKRGTLYIDTPSDVEFAEKYLAEYDRMTQPATV